MKIKWSNSRPETCPLKSLILTIIKFNYTSINLLNFINVKLNNYYDKFNFVFIPANVKEIQQWKIDLNLKSSYKILQISISSK